MTEWWHGGPSIAGDIILPPVATGAEPFDAFFVVDDAGRERLAAVRNYGRVYITTSSLSAIIYAATCRVPMVYRVDPVGDVEPDPDDTALRPTGSLFGRCVSAVVLERRRPSPIVIEQIRRDVLASYPLSRRAPGSQRWTPTTADWNRLRPPTLGDLIDCSEDRSTLTWRGRARSGDLLLGGM